MKPRREALTTWTDAFSPQIPQNSKVIGGGHSICKLKRTRNKRYSKTQKAEFSIRLTSDLESYLFSSKTWGFMVFKVWLIRVFFLSKVKRAKPKGQFTPWTITTNNTILKLFLIYCWITFFQLMKDKT